MQDLAQQFERQGIRYTADCPGKLWCSYCTDHQRQVIARRRSNIKTETVQDAHNANTRMDGAEVSPSHHHLTDVAAQESFFPFCTIDGSIAAVLDHCSSRDHLHLYEHHAQSDLAYWCPVELHGYRVLLNHHCIYPSRMFGEGRLLIDATLAGGMLLGVDVCGGVKLWPQHRYVAVELVLPSARSGIREAYVPLTSIPNSAPTDNQRGEEIHDGSLRHRSYERKHIIQILHERTEIPASVADTYKATRTKLRNSIHQAGEGIGLDALAASEGQKQKGSSNIPRYFDEGRGLRSRRVIEGNLETVLSVTNASIIAEARMRQRRRIRTLRYNYADSKADISSADTDEETGN